MFLVKTTLWILLYPLLFTGYFLISCWQALSFMFHSPVDLWIIISNSLEQQAEEQ